MSKKSAALNQIPEPSLAEPSQKRSALPQDKANGHFSKEVLVKEQNMSLLEMRLGYVFANPDLLRRALTHRSSLNHEDPANKEDLLPNRTVTHNERLEFLGDAVLNLMVSELLFHRFHEASEGDLSHWRATLVNTGFLGRLAEGLELGTFLSLGRGELLSGGRSKTNILANAMEALIGAVYLDGGREAVSRLVHYLFSPALSNLHSNDLLKDFKTLLQERLQAQGLALPGYHIVSVEGPPHERHFVIECRLSDGLSAKGNGRSKRLAEQDAAHHLLTILTHPIHPVRT